MLSTKNSTSRPSSRKFSAMVRPVSATRRRLPGGSFIWPNQGNFVDNVGIGHFVVEVVTLTSTFTHACKHRITGVLDRDVTDQLHHVYSFTNTRTTEQTDFTALSERAHQVHNFDTGFQQFLGVRQLFVRRSRTVN